LKLPLASPPVPTTSMAAAGASTLIHPDGAVDVRFLIDRGLIEAFWNGGEASYCIGSPHTAEGPAFSITGEANLEELTVHPMSDIWAQQ
jgi:hypothetical protein